MRTKTLLLTAALSAAGIATSMAQVYSVNAVGYVNKSIPKAAGKALTYALLANPLNGTNNNVATILPTGLPDGTQLFKFAGGSFSSPESFFAPDVWDPGLATIAPGEGFFLAFDNAVAPDPIVVTFVGEVPQGTLANPVGANYSIRASMVPQTGGLTTVLLLDPPADSQVFMWNAVTQRYLDPFTYFGAGEWDPSEPVVPVAEGFFILNTGAPFNWTRTFTVN